MEATGRTPKAQGVPAIVLVEDDDGLRGALDTMLTVSGFRVLAFATAEQARDAAPWDGAACLVVDLRLPGMSGLDLLRWLRHSGRGLPAIVIAAAPGEGSREGARLLGASAFLEKPIHRHAIVTAICDAVMQDGP